MYYFETNNSEIDKEIGNLQFIERNDAYYIAIVWKRGCHDFSSNHFRRGYNSIRLKEQK